MSQSFKLPTRNHKGKTVLTNARIFDAESNYDKVGSLVIENGKISDFGPEVKSTDANAEQIDCGGQLLTPGLIDIQVHFREPGQTHKEDLESGSKSAVSGGITMVVGQPNTKPVVDNLDILKQLEKREKEAAYCNFRIYPAITKEMKGVEVTHFKKLAESYLTVGFTDDGLPVMNAHLMRKAFELSKQLNMPIAQHAEDLNLSDGGCINEGEVSKKLGVKGIPNISEAVIVARDICILQKTGGHYHVLHVSTKEALDYIRIGKKQGLKVTCEASPHHFILNDKAVLEQGTLAKMNPPLRSEEDRLAIIEGLKDGTIDAIATDHAPHDPDSKNVDIAKATFGIVGVETMLPIALQLYHEKQISLRDVISKMTYKAADIINQKRGRIKKGEVADLTLIDLNKEWVIKNQAFQSRSKNSPFDGKKVTGRAIRTFLGGETVYKLD